MPNRFSSIVQLFSPVTSSLGLEITDSSIKMTELRLHKSKPPEIKAYHVEKLPKKAVEDGRILEPVTVTRALQTLTARVSQKKQSSYIWCCQARRLWFVFFEISGYCA